MSRIVGLWSGTREETISDLLNRLLISCASQKDWEFRSEVIGRLGLGWCGWTEPNIAARDGILVVMDGCIYNRAELGIDECDAELLAALYMKGGLDEAVQQVNGDFAVCVYDSRTNTLHLARDRFGAKPLYFVSKPGLFAFASRPRALLALPGVSRDVNRQFVAAYGGLHYRYVDNRPEESPYLDVAQLPAGHSLHYSHGELRINTYWSLRELPDFIEPEAELAAQYRALLSDAVALRLKSSPRPVFTLSGGMDSSSVLACAADLAGTTQSAISTVYEDKTYDESNDIASMLDATVSRWLTISVGNLDIVPVLGDMIALHDQPIATATWLSHYLLCQEAKTHGFTSLFGGLGGDELNAGEYEYFFFFFADLKAAGRNAELAYEIERWVEHHDHPIFKKSQKVVEEALARVVDLRRPGRCLPDRVRLHRYAKVLNPDYFDCDDFEPVMEHPFSSYLKNRTYQDLSRETIPCCLRAEDRQATASELGNCAPFLDHRLVEFMYRVPGSMKIRGGITKILLREAMRGILPEATRQRIKKTGWNAPAHRWFSGASRDSLWDLIRSRAFRERGIYVVEEVERLVAEHERIIRTGAMVDNHMMFLWQLVNLELWLAGLECQPAIEV